MSNNKADFGTMTIGVNTEKVKTYLDAIRSDVIEEAKNLLETEQEALFDVFRTNWAGKSEENFEHNMKEAIRDIKKSLDTHYKKLEDKIEGINNAWVDQDEDMVQRQGGIF